MVLSQYVDTQFSAMQQLDFMFRLLMAAGCGAVIGIERSKRFKEAGVRTHLVVCFAAALFMVISKYGFVDLTLTDGSDFPGTRGAGSARSGSGARPRPQGRPPSRLRPRPLHL